MVDMAVGQFMVTYRRLCELKLSNYSRISSAPGTLPLMIYHHSLSLIADIINKRNAHGYTTVY